MLPSVHPTACDTIAEISSTSPFVRLDAAPDTSGITPSAAASAFGNDSPHAIAAMIAGAKIVHGVSAPPSNAMVRPTQAASEQMPPIKIIRVRPTLAVQRAAIRLPSR